MQDDTFYYDIIVALDNMTKIHWTLLGRNQNVHESIVNNIASMYMNFQLQTLQYLNPLSGWLSKGILT